MRQDNEKGVDYEGRHYTKYEATQRQRQLERSIRKQKRRILAAEQNPNDKERLQQAQIKYQVLDQEYKRFTKAAGLRLQHERMEMAGFGPKQANASIRAYKNVQEDWISQIFKLNSEYRLDNNEFDIEQAKSDYKDFLTTVPEKNRILLEQSINSVEYEKANLKTAPLGYSPSLDKVLYDPTRTDFWQIEFTASNTHELAHRIDNFFVRSSENMEFHNAIIRARDTYFKDRGKFIRYCAENDKYGFLSDILSAISEGDEKLFAGHSAKYWMISGKKENEIFSNMSSLEAFNDKEKLVFLKENFPEMYNCFKSFEY